LINSYIECGKTNDAAQYAIEGLVATTRAKTLAEAAVQVMLACAHVDIVANEEFDSSGRKELADNAMRMLQSAMLVMTREAGIDPADFGADNYAFPSCCPRPNGALAAAE
jgi:hypothetical protein